LGGYLIEVFARFYMELPQSIDEVDISQRLFRPIMCSLRFAEVPRWKVLFSDPGYDKSQSDYDNIGIAFLNAHLAGIFGPNDRYEYHRVPKGLRIDDLAAKEEVIALAEALDVRFENWGEEEKSRQPRKRPVTQS
jgi:hypothetical protein